MTMKSMLRKTFFTHSDKIQLRHHLIKYKRECQFPNYEASDINGYVWQFYVMTLNTGAVTQSEIG